MATINVNEKNIYKYSLFYYPGAEDEEDGEYFDEEDDYDYFLIKGTAGADNITVDLPRQKVHDDDDYDGYGGEIRAGAGNDKVVLNGDVYARINAGKGNDTLIKGTDDAAFSLEYANGDGNDVVSLRGNNSFLIYLKSGSVSNYRISGNDHILKIGNGSIKIKNLSTGSDKQAYLDVYSQAYDKTLKLYHINKITKYINGQAFNVPIEAYTREEDYDDSSEYEDGYNYYWTWQYTNKATDGNDYINPWYYGEGNVEEGSVNDGGIINARKGDDYIFLDYNVKKVIQYSPGDGNDTIYYDQYEDDYLSYSKYHDENVLEGIKIQITDNSSYAIVEKGDDILIKVKSATAKNYDGSMLLKNAYGKLLPSIIGGTLDTLNSFHYIEGTSGNDKISDRNPSTFITAYAGNDTIYTDDGNATVDAGDGDDKIENGSSNSLIYAGNGNDNIFNRNASNVTLIGGAGNDIISSSGDTDKVLILGGSGNDTMYLDSAYNRDANLNLTVRAGIGDDVIRLKSANNNVIQYANGDGKDTIDFDFGKHNTIQVAGEYSTTRSGEDLIINVGDGSMFLEDFGKFNTLNIVTVAGGTFSGDDDSVPAMPSIGDSGTTSTKEREVLSNSDPKSYTASSSAITIDGSARTKPINITANANNNSVSGGTKNDTISGGAGDDTLLGNAGNDIINGGNEDDYIDGGAGNDKLFGDAGNDILVAGKGNDNLTGGAGADTFIYTSGDGKDAITDYTYGEDIIKLASGEVSKVAVSKKGDLIFTVGKGSINIKGGKGKNVEFIDNSGNTIFNQAFGSKKITFTDSDFDTINTSIDGEIITIDGSTRTSDAFILGNAKNNVISLGSGNSTVTTGKGKDTISFNGGNVVITDYASGQDRLKLNDTISSAEISNNDVILNIGSNKVTLAGAKGNKITIIDKDNVVSSLIYGSSALKIANGDGDTVKAIDGVTDLDASKRTKPLKLIGNAVANSLIGGKGKDTINGGAGADTLAGGKGNDTLTGGNGADVFYYTNGDGSDVITDYTADDIIRLGKNTSIKKAAFSGNDLILSIGSGKLTIQGGATQTVTVVDEDNLEALYRKRSSTADFQECWFTKDDDNFITSDVSSLLKTDNLISEDSNLNIDGKVNFNQGSNLTCLQVDSTYTKKDRIGLY